MSYSEFTLPSLIHRFGLEVDDASDLFADVPVAELRPSFKTELRELIPLALAVSSEKARSELIIAPVLLEVWRMTGRRVSFFSGVTFDVDRAQGLEGLCDYIFSCSPRQLYIEAPVVMLVEAKNEDMKRGYGQCLAEMVAAQRFNIDSSIQKQKIGQCEHTVYGAVTTGERWKFLELSGTHARIDIVDYYIEHVDKIIGILVSLLNVGTVVNASDND